MSVELKDLYWAEGMVYSRASQKADHLAALLECLLVESLEILSAAEMAYWLVS